MKRAGSLCVVAALMLATLGVASNVEAAPTLQELLFNLNGTTYANTSVPGLNSAGFNTATGLGTLVLTFGPAAPGTYFFDAFFDHNLHTPFFNEFGAASGAAGSLRWQIDEPEHGGDANRLGTIFTDTSLHLLDNTNHVPGTTSNFFGDCGANGGGAVDSTCNNDVSLALGFDIPLAAGEQAVITLVASQTQPGSGFFLVQVGPPDGTPQQPAEVLFLSGTLSISPVVAPVPEPSSLLLVGPAGVAIAWYRRRRNAPTAHE